jgi:hypothetical protein
MRSPRSSTPIAALKRATFLVSMDEALASGSRAPALVGVKFLSLGFQKNAASCDHCAMFGE